MSDHGSDPATARDGGEAGPRPDEDEKQRIDRELVELLQELRVVIPGVQVLFAFLLTITFAQGFTKLDADQRMLYFATLLCSAAAATLLMSPTSYHRLVFRHREKKRMLFTVNRLAIAGLVLLAAAMVLAVLVITSVLFGTTAEALVLAGMMLWFGWFWYGLPLMRRLRSRREGASF